MDTCASCQAELAPEWKYCIRCGTPVDSAPERIPGAIRPDPVLTTPRRGPDVQILVWGGVGLIGMIVVIVALVNSFGSHVG